MEIVYSFLQIWLDLYRTNWLTSLRTELLPSKSNKIVVNDDWCAILLEYDVARVGVLVAYSQ